MRYLPTYRPSEDMTSKEQTLARKAIRQFEEALADSIVNAHAELKEKYLGKYLQDNDLYSQTFVKIEANLA